MNRHIQKKVGEGKEQKSTGRREKHTEGGTERRHALKKKNRKREKQQKKYHDNFNIPNFRPYSTPPIF